MGSTSQWEGTPRSLLIVLAICVAIGGVAIWLGVPMLAGVVATRVPSAVVTTLGDGVLAMLDQQTFKPSRLPQATQQRITEQFASLRARASRDGMVAAAHTAIVFRHSDEIGANAIALPSGTIIVTDGLVALAGDDREILGTLAHEAGHVERRHGVRLLLQNSFASVVLGWLLGDFSAIAAAAPKVLLEARYSRDLEREADAYAAQMMRAGGIPARYLASMLERLDTAGAKSRASGRGLEYLSSHPATAERLEALRRE